MPGSGKSTLGKELASHLDWAFIDTDNLLTAWFGLKLEQLLSSLGLEGFLQAEKMVVQELILHRCIIATGGSVIYSENAMRKLQQIGLITYLHADYRIIEKRVSQNPQRGLVAPKGQDLWEVYQERVPLYREYAELEISTQTGTLQECVYNLMEGLNEKENFPEIKRILDRGTE
uniref:Shikimate kinase n=1 Tax=uncultured organism TaxID=155900 RepID=M1PWY1_9ZZZZ|nr:shikimate kinase [uncultured organism]